MSTRSRKMAASSPSQAAWRGDGQPALPRLPVAIRAGGLGTRLSEETATKPKPLVEIGGRPVIWHVMKHYETYGMNEFGIALGHKKEAVLRYFLELHTHNRDLTVRTRDGSVSFHRPEAEVDWTVHLIDTGAATATGGRIRRLQPYLGGGTFMLTWCDGVSNVDLAELLAFHRSHGRSEEPTSELQSLMRISYAVFCLQKKIIITKVRLNINN